MSVKCMSRIGCIVIVLFVSVYWHYYYSMSFEVYHSWEDQSLAKMNESFERKTYAPASASTIDRHSILLHSLVPTCDNILKNMTRGAWVRKIDLPRFEQKIKRLVKDEEELESELKMFWVKRGIQTAFWRKDHQCGYFSYETQPPNSTWPKVGSWCNPKSDRPCCSDSRKGICSKPSDASCKCSRCIDLRQYLHAEVSEWVVMDRRCKWRDYSASEICAVIEHSPFSDILFVGDSFMRNMYRTFVMMVADDFYRGALKKSAPIAIQKLCTKNQQFFWPKCRKSIYNISKSLNHSKLCGGRGYANFTATFSGLYSNKFKTNFLNLVKSKINIPGSLIIVGVGFHMHCLSGSVIKGYLGPAIEAINDFYGQPPPRVDPKKLSGRWPQIMLCLPLKIGLLKPTQYLELQNEVKCRKYSSDMKAYSDSHDIRVLDFHELTTLVYSFDGIHHGMGVNKIKNLILLNHVATFI